MRAIESRLRKLEQIVPAVVHRPPGMGTDEFFALMTDALRGTLPGNESREVDPWLRAMTRDELRQFRDMLEEQLTHVRSGPTLDSIDGTVAATTSRRRMA